MRPGPLWSVLELLVLSITTSITMQAQSPEMSKTVQEFVRVRAPEVVLTHVRIIDGTGAPAVEDQNVVIEGGKITGVQKGSDLTETPGTTVLDLHGYTVIPGLVGM